MKKKFKKFDYHYILLVFLSIIFLLGTMKINNFFGSSVDWYNQHIMFPEYFRNLFYETGNLFPSFAFNIGGGQNIYNFSYYGLYNPLLLCSYFFPFIKMIDYMQILNVLLYISVGILTYMFLKKEVTKKIAFIGSIFFLLANPLLFHIHRHYMFISYFPFLLINLLSIRKYFEKKSIAPFIIFNTLLILTSYYYSISAILVEVIYFTYCYLKNKKFVIKDYLLKGIPLALGVTIAIGISCILLLPTLASIKTGRSTNLENLKWYEIIFPNLNIKNVFYDSYGLGLSFISVIAIIYYSFKKYKDNSKRFLSITLLICLFLPFMMYILNGKLYIRSKVLIPFIPLVILILSHFLEDIFKKKVISKKIVISTFILFLIFNLFYDSDLLLLFLLVIDFILTYLFLSTKSKNNYLFFILCFLFITNIGISFSESFIDHHYSNEKDSTKSIMSTIKEDQDIYRMKQTDFSLRNVNRIYSPRYYTSSVYSSLENKDYKDFLKYDLKMAFPNRNKLMLTASHDIIYDSYLGVKYVVGKDDLFGYQKRRKNIYYNSNNRGIIYASSNVLNLDEYEDMEYPYNLEYLFRGVIINKKGNFKVDSKINKVDKPLRVENKNITNNGNRTIIKTKKDMFFNISKSEELKDKILFIKFRINNKSSCDYDDRYITINGIRNKLSCASDEYEYQNDNYVFHYVLATNKNYDIKIGKGEYDISDLEVYSMDYDEFSKLNDNINNMKFDYDKTKGDKIEGKITVEKEGYLITSIPYDKGFSIYIDGKKSKLLKVNKAFIGTPLAKGRHTVKIVYKAPLLGISKVISCISLVLLGIIVIYEKFVRCKVLEKSINSVSQE